MTEIVMNKTDLENLNIKQANRKALKSFAHNYGITTRWYNLKSTIRKNIKIAIIGVLCTIDDINRAMSIMGVKDYEVKQGPVGDMPGIVIIKSGIKYYNVIEKWKFKKSVSMIEEIVGVGILIKVEYK